MVNTEEEDDDREMIIDKNEIIHYNNLIYLCFEVGPLPLNK
jgi:hypothetical protein